MTKAQKNAIKRYKRKTIVKYHLELNRNTDADILHWLDIVPNMASAIKDAIREHIKRNGYNVPEQEAEPEDELPEYDENGDYI